MVDKYKIIFLIELSGLFLEHFWIFKLKSSGFSSVKLSDRFLLIKPRVV